MSQTNRAEHDDEELMRIASALVNGNVQRVVRSSGGGNSRIYKVEANNAAYALKMYPLIENDPRDRLGVEKKTLLFFERHGLDCVPRWINDCPGYALLSWVEGELANPPTSQELDKAIDFLGDIKCLSGMPDAVALPAASEACVSGAEVIAQIERRLQRLQEVSDLGLEEFIKQGFAPSFAKACAAAQMAYAKAGIEFDRPLAGFKCLIPADFGFHNVMRGAGGALTFIDFEYFGWDDPVKLTADFLLHPGMTLTPVQRSCFYTRMQEVFADDACFTRRLQALMPLFALRWALILLNEFLPERWSGRAFAQGDGAWKAAKDRQLAKATEMLQRVTLEEFNA